VVIWNLVYSKYAIKDVKKLSAAGLTDKARTLLDISEVDPLQNPRLMWGIFFWSGDEIP